MSTPTPQPEDDLILIDQYLAGELGHEAMRAVETRLASEPGLAEVMSAQRAVSESLRRAVPMPRGGLAETHMAVATATVRGPVGESVPVSRGFRPLPVLGGLAAAAAITLGILVWSGAFSGGGKAEPKDAWFVAERDGFAATYPESDCQRLRAMVIEKLGEGLTLPCDSGEKYIGIRTGVGESPVGFGIVAKVKGLNVLLVLDRASSGARSAGMVSEPSAHGLYRHSGVFGQVRAVEWSESPTPLLLRGKAK